MSLAVTMTGERREGRDEKYRRELVEFASITFTTSVTTFLPEERIA
jgi:hypothetical protein